MVEFTTIAQVLREWDTAGVFDFLLPALLIFAIVFAILTTTRILGENKGVNVLIGAVIALLAIRLEFVPRFFSEIFPRLGVGLAVLLAVLILVGLFVYSEYEEDTKVWNRILMAIGLVIIIVTLTKSFDALGWFYSYAGGDLAGWLIGIVLVIGLIVAVVSASGGKKSGETQRIQYRKARPEE